MAPDVLSPQHSEASAPQPGMNGQANQARCLLPARPSPPGPLHATASALPLSPHPLPAKGWTCQMNTDGLPEWIPPRWIDHQQRPQLNTRIRHLLAQTPTQQKATTSQSRLNVMSIQVRGLRWPTPLTPRPRSTSLPIGQQRTYWGLPDIRQAVGPGWIGLRTDRQ
jgi:hypothetical protein